MNNLTESRREAESPSWLDESWYSANNSSREQELENVLSQILEELDQIGFCCGYNNVVEGIRSKITQALNK